MSQQGKDPWREFDIESAEEGSPFSVPGTLFREMCPDPVRVGDIFPGILADIGSFEESDFGALAANARLWPRKVWIVKYGNGSVGTIRHDGVYGLAAFVKRANCVQFAASLPNPPSRTWLVKQMPLEEARLLAKRRAGETALSLDPIKAMILCDSGPLVLFVA